VIVRGTAGDLVIASRPAQPYGAYASVATDTVAGRSVSPEGALAIAHVYGAVRLVSTTAGTLPLEVIDTRTSTNSVVSGARISSMLRYRPNQDMSAAVVWTLVVAHLMLRGNAYLAKLRDASGYVSELVPFNPQYVHPFRDDDGVKKFRVTSWDSIRFVDAVFDSSQILHITGPALTDGLKGASPIEAVRNRMGVQMAQSESQGRFYSQGMHAKGVLKTPAQTLTREAVDRLRTDWQKANHGLDNVGNIPILHSGLEYQSVSMSPADSQFIETMQWGANEIATIFSIPAGRLNADAGKNQVKYANVGQDDVHFLKQAVLPMLTFIESALNMDDDLFGYLSAWVPRFNPAEALRVDQKTRFEAYSIATSGQPWMTQQEVRDIEGLGPNGPGLVQGASAPVVSNTANREQRGLVDDAPVFGTRSEPIVVQVGPQDQPAPQVTVNVPEQAPPVVNVHVPEQAAPVVNVDAPIVNVAAPNVEVAAPNVSVDAPVVNLTPEIVIENPARSVKFSRDSSGKITNAEVK